MFPPFPVPARSVVHAEVDASRFGGRPVFYRYTDPMVYEDGSFHPIEVSVYVGEKRTRQGWWVVPEYLAGTRPDLYHVKNSGRWISDVGPYQGPVPPRRWAYQDRQDAMRAYRWRKVRQIQHAASALDMARWAKEAIEAELAAEKHARAA